MSVGGGRVSGKGRFVRGRGYGGHRNFNISINLNKEHELKFDPHGYGLYQHIVKFTKVKEHLILKI